MHIGGGHHHEDASCQNCLSLIGLPSPTLGKVPFFFERQTELTSFGQQSAFQCCLFCLLFFIHFLDMAHAIARSIKPQDQ